MKFNKKKLRVTLTVKNYQDRVFIINLKLFQKHKIFNQKSNKNKLRQIIKLNIIYQKELL